MNDEFERLTERVQRLEREHESLLRCTIEPLAELREDFTLTMEATDSRLQELASAAESTMDPALRSWAAQASEAILSLNGMNRDLLGHVRWQAEAISDAVKGINALADRVAALENLLVRWGLGVRSVA